MSLTTNASTTGNHEVESLFDIDITAWVSALYRRRIRIIQWTALFAIVAVVYCLRATPIFRSHAVLILPADSKSGAQGLISQFGALTGIQMPGQGERGANFYIGLIKCRRLAVHVIEKFDLMNLLGIEKDPENTERYVTGFINGLEVNSNDDGFMTIDFDFYDPKIAHDVINEIITETNQLINELNIVKAREERLFLEERIAETFKDIDSIEVQINRFSKDSNVIEFDSQAHSTVVALSELLKKKSEIQLELQLLEKSSIGNEHPEYKAKKLELDMLTEQYDRIITSDHFDNSLRLKPLLPLSAITQLEMQQLRFRRELDTQAEIMKMLRKQYELSKIEEKKDSLHLRILDPPTIPVIKFGPKRRVIFAVTVIMGFLASVLYYTAAFLLDTKRSAWNRIFNSVKDVETGK